MRSNSDFGNFLVLLIVATLAGAYFGDWAFKTVAYGGLAVMIISFVIYAFNEISSVFGPFKAKEKDEGVPRRVKRSKTDSVRNLLRAVEAKDGAAIERLVLKGNVSPFEAEDWKDTTLSANSLATQMGYEPATRFFKEWSSNGNTARFKH